MKQTVKPYDDEDRLLALEKVIHLSSDSEERFNRVTRIAQRMFNVPMVDFSFISADQQLLKSSYGLDLESIPRDISLANYAILKNELFLIPDTLKDSRFAGNPLVVDRPKIRFFAAYPVHSRSGHRVGVLSIADRQPGSLSAHDQSAFRDLADMVENELSYLEVTSRDRLTRLSINDGFHSLAEQGLNVCVRQDAPAVAIVFDLHQPQDALIAESKIKKDIRLKMFAEQLKQFFRRSDIVGRLGSDEFTALLLNARSQHVDEIVRKLQASIDEYNAEVDNPNIIAFKHAVAEFDPQNPVSSSTLVKMANYNLQQLPKAM
ncbi:sensor domain-containing diguanylate cyclase [Reinekea marinisedimentorum]|uniref:Diguanylate cyclase (GGDEF)-like protein n=1 Tax=Reinekea marinisedimentorum TaxID=230495 RepID=A0A4R3IDP1_9GAMM|nr:diguanylate cyclase [Reinekea marinisedimentorum]TCS43688.1 diguanylate cyclase (GGDEF)-like protein [Reinekea marinisedimentorum]